MDILPLPRPVLALDVALMYRGTTVYLFGSFVVIGDALRDVSMLLFICAER